MSVDSLTFRRTLGSFASGVTVITTHDPASGKPVGVTVSAFSSVSMDPPLVLFCLDKRSASLLSFNANGHFAANILAANQVELSNRFASKAEDKWDGVSHRPGLAEVPVLAGTAAHLECTVVKEVDGGDHMIIIGQVEAASYNQDLQPLVYCRGGYAELKGDVK